MRTSEGKIGLYTSGDLLGMDLRHTASREHGRYMENLLCVDGALRKRNGVLDLFSIEDENGNALPINGIYDYLGTIIVHAGNSLYNCGQSPLERKITYKPQKINSEIILESKPLDGFVHNGRLWLVGNKELLYLDGTTLSLLGEGAYAPTTREAINSIANGASYKEKEAENVLCARRKNSFKGTKAQKSSYELDCKIDEEKSFSLSCQMSISLNDTDTQAHYTAYTGEARIEQDYVSGALGAPSSEIAKILDGTGTSYGFDALSEVNIFLKAPCYVTELVLTAQAGSGVPMIRLSLGASTVYEDTELSGKKELDISSEVRGKIIDSITLYGNNSVARIKAIKLLARKNYEGEVELIFRESKAQSGKTYIPKEIVAPSGERLALYTNLEGSATKSPYISFSNGINCTNLNLYFEAPCYIQSRDNIVLTYSKKNVSKPKISLAKECKTSTGEQILALCLNDNELCFTSGSVGFTYAPRSHYTVLGNSGKITALCQMQDYGVGAYKEKEGFYVSITEQGIKYTGSMQSNGCVNNRCAVTIGDDTMALCKNGVFGSGRDALARPRSSAISSLIRAEMLDSAFCLEHQSRLYVFLENKCLVCDTAYKTQARWENDFEYEWFLLTGLNARCAVVLNDTIYLGTSDGKIRTLGKGFCDISYRKLLSGEYIINENQGTELCLSSELNVQENSEIMLENAFVVLLENPMQVEMSYGAGFILDYEEMLYENGTTRLYTGMEIFALSNDEIYLGEIVEMDEQNGIVATTLPCENEYSFLLKDAQGCKITIKKSGQNYKMYENESEIKLVEYENATVALVEKTPVVAKYESGVLSLGNEEVAKNLHRIILDLLPSTAGEVTLGYETNKSNVQKAIIIGKDLDFNDLDFGSLTLGKSIQKGCVARCFERGFSNIIIKISSSAPCDFGLRGFSLAYTETGLLSYDRG